MNASNWPSSTPRVLFGKTFDDVPYQITLSSDKPFGRGGSAVIHRGELWGPQPLVVAVKMFHDHGAIDGDVREALLHRELHAARQVSMRHPSILAYLGTAHDGRNEAIVSLYMQNGNLLQYLKANPHSDKKKLIVQVAEAVNYLHSVEHLVHGDLKCDNVLVSDYGEALLADFGLSRFLELVHSAQATMTGIRQMYTIHFAAPELLFSEEEESQADDEDLPSHSSVSYKSQKPPPKTRESDVYAFGMLVLEAVTEELPWARTLKKIPPPAHGAAIIKRVLAEKRPPQPSSQFRFVSISHSWWNVCNSCWSHDPADRPRMHFVLEALTHAGLDPCHTGSVTSVACIPHGCRVVSGSSDGTIRIWDTVTGRTVIGPLVGHEGPVCSVAVSPDGCHICSGSVDTTIRRWDAESGAPIGAPMIGHSNDVTSVAFSPDGAWIVSCSGDQTVRLWDTATGEALADPLARHTDWVWSVAFSPDGAYIAFGSSGGTVHLWDSATGANLGILHHPETKVNALCFSPDRVHLVSGCTDGVIQIWDISTQQLVRDIKEHSTIVRSVAVSPSGVYIASASFDESIRIWNAQTGDAVGAPLSGHTEWIESVAFSTDGRSLVYGSHDGTVRIWDIFE